ncbi:AprI/Inh family metalloprotease inhibitor [Undibacter mobilis]|nr:AprI/Inh family metalloprotease inhibitor [Undibacter mobilis]
MRRDTGKSLPILCLVMLTLALAGCGGGAALMFGADEKPQAAGGADVGKELGMEGRWVLAAPNAPSCGLTFTGPPSATDGRVTPDGGCPERFFLARRWRLSDGLLTVIDGDGTSLGTFRNAGDRFDGKSATETTITLSR